MARPAAGASYLWMAARSRNAMRRIGVIGIMGGIVFITALLAFVLVPRRATRAAAIVTTQLEPRPDSMPVVTMRDRAAAQIALADSLLVSARRVANVPPPPVIDTLPPELRARRDSLANVVSTLGRLIERANEAPLPVSYRALANAPGMAADPGVRALLDSLTELEREREAFGAVGGIDPVYVALTSRVTALGRAIQSAAEAKVAAARMQHAALRPALPPPMPQVRVDTMRYVVQKQNAEREATRAVQMLAQIKGTHARIDEEAARARRLANVGAPPLAMLAAALILALTFGYAVAFGLELARPHVADSREAEQVTGLRVLTTVRGGEVAYERARRQSDIVLPPLIDLASHSYRKLYLHLTATEASVPIVTVAGDDVPIVGTVAANLAAAATFDARSTLLVDIDAESSAVAGVLRLRSNPGLAGVIAGTADWPEAIVTAAIGRDQTMDVIPSGTRKVITPRGDTAESLRQDFARLSRRYDLTVVSAPAGYLLSPETIIPAPDAVFCCRVARTTVAHLSSAVAQMKEKGFTVHGIVLWDDDLPTIELREEVIRARDRRSPVRPDLVGTR